MNLNLPHLYLIGLLITACGIDKPTFTKINSPVITLQTDINLLSQYITIPEGVKAVDWVVVPLGNAESVVPGPTDTVIYAFVTFKNNNWSSIKGLSVTNLNSSIAELPEKIAEKIIPATELKKLVRNQDKIRVEGTRYNSNYFNKGAYRGIYAVQIGDGLLICLQTF
jgi:hypothetical protein